MDGVAEGVVPAASVDEAARLIREPGFDLLLICHGLLLVLEGTVMKAVSARSFRRHDAPTEVVAISNGTALEWHNEESASYSE
jgi:hypothetical protein